MESLNLIFEDILNQLKKNDKYKNYFELMESKLNNFLDFLKTILTDENKKWNFEERINKLKWMNKVELYFFLLSITQNDKETNVNKIMNLLHINEQHRPKINDYYDCFMDMRQLIM